MKKLPYQPYRNLQLWKVVESEINELEKNQDVEVTTQRDIVIGSLVKAIQDSGLSREDKYKGK